jgi:hypothetical protein
MKEINFLAPTKCPQGAIFKFTSSLFLFTFASAAKKDADLRPIFNLKEQLEIMGVGGDANFSVVGKSFRSINIFLNEGKVYTTSAKLSSFIDASYLKRVADDPVLSKIANAK